MTKKPAQNTLAFFISSIFVILILILSFLNINQFFKNQRPDTKILGAEDSQEYLQKEREFWKNTTVNNPTYRDGWLELSKIECDLGENFACQEDYNKAVAIDPNYSF